jgi:hypothetical protein
MTNFLLQFLEASEIAVPQVAVVLVREAAHFAVNTDTLTHTQQQTKKKNKLKFSI